MKTSQRNYQCRRRKEEKKALVEQFSGGVAWRDVAWRKFTGAKSDKTDHPAEEGSEKASAAGRLAKQ